MQIIPLWAGRQCQKFKIDETFVDDDHFEYLSQWKWVLYMNRKGGSKYAIRYECDVKIRMHNVVADLIGLDRGDLIIDHKDRNGLNNQSENLQVVTHSENLTNQKLRVDNKSGVAGVHILADGRAVASIQVDGKTIGSGYMTLEEAIAWRQTMELKYYSR